MATKDPRQFEFWSDEEQEQWNAVSRILLEIYYAGLSDAEEALPANVRALIDWNRVSEAALEWLRKYREMFVKVMDTTRKQSIKAIEDWIQSGEPLDSLEKRLEPIYGPERAERIAVTEVTRIYAEANQAVWKESGVVGGNKWRTARDELVCPICAPLDEMTVSLGENEFTTEEGGLGIAAPPAHINCRCWLTPVVDTGLYEKRLDEIFA